MKRILTSALAIVLFIGAANAQPQTQNRTQNRGGIEMALNGVDLTSDQQNKLKTINEEYRKQMMGLRDQNLSPDQMKEKREDLRQQHVTSILAVLTTEQKAKVLENQAKNRTDNNKNNRADSTKKGMKKGYGDRKDKIDDMNLSADQQAKIKTIREGYKVKLDALRNDASVTGEAKKVKMKALMQAQQAEVKAILTPEQQAKIKDGRKEGRKRKN